jgi:hypothetical protein
MRTTANSIVFVIVGIVALTTVFAGTSNAGLHVEFTYRSAPADVRVWMGSAYDNGGRYYDGDYYNGGYEYDVYPSENDVVLYVRASRSCYTTVYVIDTEGFVHVVHPLSPAHDAYLIGGRVYRYRLSDFGFYEPCFNRGVAYAFAVGSPVPFNYAHYGAGIFGPRIGFRIYGDPFVASRMFYASILPPACHRNLVAVGYARFYVREYRRYPGYLCAGWHHYHGVRTHCRGNCAAHRHYRIHAADPNRVIHPRREFRPGASDLAKIDRTASKDIRDIRVVSEKRKRHHDNVRINEKKKRAVETSHERTVRSTDSKRTARRIDVKRVDRGQAGGRGAKEQRTVTMTTRARASSRRCVSSSLTRTQKARV